MPNAFLEPKDDLQKKLKTSLKRRIVKKAKNYIKRLFKLIGQMK